MGDKKNTPVWSPFYVNNKKISSISSQISPGIINSYKKVLGRAKGMKGGFRIGIGNIFGGILKGDSSIDLNASKNDSEEVDFTFEKIDQNTHKFLIYAQNNHAILDENSTSETLIELKKGGLIKFSGLFDLKVEGKSYSEKSFFIEGATHLHWVGTCGTIKVALDTGKESLISLTPLYYVLRTKRNKLQLAGFGTLQANAKTPLSINPIYIGTPLH